jgi:hypothetical protein
MADLAQATSVQAVADHVQERYGYGDFTGIGAEHLPTLISCVAEIDRLAAVFVHTTVPLPHAPDSKFYGLGTTLSLHCPPNVKGQMGGAWGATKWTTLHNQDGSFARANGPVIWLNPQVFIEGTGLYGEIGFTFARSPIEATIHEFGHVVADLTPDAEKELQGAVYATYGFGDSHRRTSIGRDVSIYALGSSEEQHAEVFTVLNAEGGLARLKSDAARTRLRRLGQLTNQRLRGGKAGWRLGPTVRGL